jgi:hypothetical protein
MLKECVILNGQIINIGPWDYQIQQVQVGGDEENPIYEDQEMNPLPDGATFDQRDFEYDPDRGWYEVGTAFTDPDAELAAAIQAATTLTELKAALLGNGKLARVKGKLK